MNLLHEIPPSASNVAKKYNASDSVISFGAEQMGYMKQHKIMSTESVCFILIVSRRCQKSRDRKPGKQKVCSGRSHGEKTRFSMR